MTDKGIKEQCGMTFWNYLTDVAITFVQHPMTGDWLQVSKDYPGCMHGMHMRLRLLYPCIDLQNTIILVYCKLILITSILYTDELQRHHQYYDKVRELIEDMYNESGNKNVTLVCFSLGCPISYYLLTKYSGVDSTWKNKYINHYITIAGAWDGGVVGLDALISGRSQVVSLLMQLLNISPNDTAKFVRTIVGNMQSVYTLIPKGSVWGDEKLIEFNDKAYSAIEYKDMFRDLALGEYFLKHVAVEDLYGDFETAPEVPTLCMYSTGIDTPRNYTYKVNTDELYRVLNDSSLIEVGYGDGDGIVNIENAVTCLKWHDQAAPFESRICRGMKHGDGCGQEMFTWIEEIVLYRTNNRPRP